MLISNKNLDLDPASGGRVAIRVDYQVTFPPAERHLTGLNVRFREEIDVFENDFGEVLVMPGGGAPQADLLAHFGRRILPVTDGNGNQVIKRSRTLIIPRNPYLDEDPAGLDPDEVRCRIRIVAIGLPFAEELTDIEIVPS